MPDLEMAYNSIPFNERNVNSLGFIVTNWLQLHMMMIPVEGQKHRPLLWHAGIFPLWGVLSFFLKRFS